MSIFSKIGKVAKTGVDIGAKFHIPIVTQIDAGIDQIDSMIKKDAPVSKADLAGVKASLEGSRALQDAVAAMTEAAGVDMSTGVTTATSTDKGPLESKKFIALLLGIATMVMTPYLQNLGFTMAQADQIMEAIKMVVGVYIASQGITDASQALRTNPKAQTVVNNSQA